MMMSTRYERTSTSVPSVLVDEDDVSSSADPKFVTFGCHDVMTSSKT